MAKKTVLKLMRSLRLVCKVRRRKRYASYRGEQGVVAPNLLNREFEAVAPNQKWVTDVIEFRVGDRKLYLSPVMDLFDRQIISYSIGLSRIWSSPTPPCARPSPASSPGSSHWCIRIRDSNTSTSPGAPCSRTPERSNQCPARATVTTMR